MSEQAQDIPTLTVDGVNYPIDSLPGEIRDLISCYQAWEKELDDQKMTVFKTEAAMRAVSAEIQSRIRQLTAAAAAAKETPSADEHKTVQ